ncbi:hypothetical protein BDW62DRAFT_174768 [Aspergillus aurantiobrunneus]
MQGDRGGYSIPSRARTHPRRRPFLWPDFDDDEELDNKTRRALVPRWVHGRALSATAATRAHSTAKHDTGSLSRKGRPRREEPNEQQEREGRYEDQETGLSARALQNIWTPSTKQNMTMHFEMQVAEDVDALLEEFSRLKKLGDFHSAEQYFHENLDLYANLLPVVIEYADMLLEQGSYNRVDQFMGSQRSLITKITEDLDMQQETVMYLANLNLIEAFADMHSHRTLDGAYKVVRYVEKTMRPILRAGHPPVSRLDSAHVQIIRYALKILSHIERETDLVPERHFDYWSNWAYLYKPLVQEGRIWDARDIILASLEAEGAHNTWGMIFKDSATSPSAFAQLFSDWDIVNYDESTYLALLDIIVAVSLSLAQYCFAVPDRSDILIAQGCLHQARGLATCLKENNPELVKSRSYLRWVLAEEEIQRKLHLGPTDLQAKLSCYPGLTVWTNSLPIYVPIKTENPADHRHPGQTDEASAADDELLECVQDAARASGDLATEALCLGELIYRSRGEMEERLARMQRLQLSLQGDILGHEHTLLSTFLFATTEHTRRELLEELRNLQSQTRGYTNFGLSEWCAWMVDRALCLSLGLDPQMAVDDSYSTHLPQYIKDQLINTGLDTIYGMDLESGEAGNLRGANEHVTQTRHVSISSSSSSSEPEAEGELHLGTRNDRAGSYERIRPSVVHEEPGSRVHADPYERGDQMPVADIVRTSRHMDPENEVVLEDKGATVEDELASLEE